MGYNLINWENSPSKQTPINAENLNQMDVNIAKAIQGTRFNFSATFTSDGVLKNTTSTEALGAGSFATSQTDIVTVFVADNVTKIDSGAFSGCTSLKTIYIDNTVGNVEIVSGAIHDGVSIVYSNDDNFINVNELLASAIKSLKTNTADEITKLKNQATTDKTEWQNRADEIEQQATSDIESLKADKLDKTDFNSYKTSNDNAVNSKVDTTDFNTYKTATDKAVADNTKSIKANVTAIDKCVTDIANNSALISKNQIKVTTDKSTSIVLNDSSDCNIVNLVLYGKSTQSAIPSPTNPVDINNINNPSITFSNDSDSQSINTQYTLRGIGNVCDTLTVNSDGTGYITQNLLYERITSGKSQSGHTWQYSTTSKRFYRNDSRYKANAGTPNLLCSHFEVKDNERDLTLDNSIGFTSVTGLGVAIRMLQFDGDISAFENWLDNNEVYILIPLKQPIITKLSKDQVDKILSLHTYFPNTTIVADTDCQVEYVADTKNYIDSKFNELATAIVAHESEVN